MQNFKCMIRWILVFVLVPFLLYSQQERKLEIVILHVNDMHARIDKLPYLASMVKSYQQKYKHVFLFSAGDVFSGNPIVDKFSEKGQPMIDLMNHIPFSLSTLGNHEFDYGYEVLSRRLSELKHPVVVANIKKSPVGFPKLKTFEEYNIDGIKMIVVGVTQTTDKGYPDTNPERVKDFIFDDGITSIKKMAKRIKKYPLRIVLSHMGVERDSMLALSMPEITAIVGGHSHKALQPAMVVNGVTIVQAENYLKYLGVLKITIQNKKVIAVSDTLIPIDMNIIKPDSLLLLKVSEYNNNKEFKTIVGYLGDSIKGIEKLGCFMTEAYRVVAKTNFAIQNSGGIRVNDLPGGPITKKHIYELDPFGNELFICKLKPVHLRKLIEYGYYKEGHLDIFSSGFKSVIHLNSNAKITKIDLYDNAGNLLDENKFYSVAIGSYLLNAYPVDKTIEKTSLGTTTTDALFKFLSMIKSYRDNNCNCTEIAQ